MELLTSGLQYPAGERQNRPYPTLSRAEIPLVLTKEVPGDFCSCHPHDTVHHCGGVPTPFLAHTGVTQVPWQLLLWLNQGEFTFQFPLAWKRPLEKKQPCSSPHQPSSLPAPAPSIVHSQLICPGRADAPRSQDSVWQLGRETLRVCLFWGQVPVLQDRRVGV